MKIFKTLLLLSMITIPHLSECKPKRHQDKANTASTAPVDQPYPTSPQQTTTELEQTTTQNHPIMQPEQRSSSPTSPTTHSSQRMFRQSSEDPLQVPQNSQSFNIPTSTIAVATATATTHLTPKEVQTLSQLAADLTSDWDDANPDGPKSTRPKPSALSFWDAIVAVPQSWWEAHVSDHYRVERLRIFCGLTTTYALLLEKITSGEYYGFIQALNEEQGEGNRWLDAALQETVKAELERPTRRLLTSSTEFIPNLPQTTHTKVTSFLSKLADAKRKALQEELVEYSRDQEDLANLVRSVQRTELEMHSNDDRKQFAQSTALTVTMFGSHSLFPRMTEPKK